MTTRKIDTASAPLPAAAHEQRRVTLFYDDRVLQHHPDVGAAFLPGRLDRRVRELLGGSGLKWAYPEHPGRVRAVLDALEHAAVPGLHFQAGRAATLTELGRVHTASFLDTITGLRGQNAWVDVDTTAVSPGSLEAAMVAAGTATAAVEAVVRGETRSSFALVRPPGHHAEPTRARGFCLFNNVAVAAAHAQAELGCNRVLIIDWDAHHGNGTQEIFFADPDVMLFDTHRSAPFYPGSGNLAEVGAGLGEGTIVNVPLPAGAGDAALISAFNDILVPAADWFQPDLVLVSAGFDAHQFDLALNATFAGFGALTGVVQGIADRHCEGRLTFVLEGGYHLEALAGGVRTVLEVLAGAPPPIPRECGLQEVSEAAAFHLPGFAQD